MTWLVETPWPVIVGTLFIEGALAIWLFRTGQGKALTVMGIVLALALSLVALEYFVVTDVEEVEGTLRSLAAALEANDASRALVYVAPDARGVRNAAERYLPRFHINSARVARDIVVTIDDGASQQTATARFTARVNANDKRGQMPYENWGGEFTVKLRRDGDRWLVYEYDVSEPSLRMIK